MGIGKQIETTGPLIDADDIQSRCRAARVIGIQRKTDCHVSTLPVARA